MKNAVLTVAAAACFASLGGCVSYHSLSADQAETAKAAGWQCTQEAMHSTPVANYFGAVGSAIVADDRQRAADACMLRHGFARDS